MRRVPSSSTEADLPPYVVVLVAAQLRQHGLAGCGDPLFDLCHLEHVERVDGEHRAAASGQDRIERRRTVTAAENAQAEIELRQVKHADIFIIRPSPRDDFVERKSHCCFLLATSCFFFAAALPPEKKDAQQYPDRSRWARL